VQQSASCPTARTTRRTSTGCASPTSTCGPACWPTCAARGVGATFHYQPLHLSEVGRAAGGRPGDCPVTEAAADTLVRLPLYTDLTAAEVDRVLDAVTSFTP
jgi:dTDP-4-amino-4,6-dideoxygalactose transaminase